MPRKGTGDGLPGCGWRLRDARIQIDATPQVLGTKVITKRLAVSLLMRVATGQTRCATSGVPFSRAALSNKDVWRLLLRATLIAAAIALLSFGGAGPKMNAAISDAA
jgi:hypothetical protein